MKVFSKIKKSWIFIFESAFLFVDTQFDAEILSQIDPTRRRLVI